MAEQKSGAVVRRVSKPEPVFISPEIMQASFSHYNENKFALWL